jgi:hypothetical protein
LTVSWVHIMYRSKYVQNVAVQSKAKAWSRFTAGIAASNPAYGMDVRFLR